MKGKRMKTKKTSASEKRSSVNLSKWVWVSRYLGQTTVLNTDLHSISWHRLTSFVQPGLRKAIQRVNCDHFKDSIASNLRPNCSPFSHSSVLGQIWPHMLQRSASWHCFLLSNLYPTIDELRFSIRTLGVCPLCFSSASPSGPSIHQSLCFCM